MGTNKNLFILLGLAVVALVATMMSGAFDMSEEPDFAQQMATERGGPVSTPAPVVDPTPTPTATPAAGESLTGADSRAGSGTPAAAGLENPCSEEPAELVANADAEGTAAGAEGTLGSASLTEGDEEGLGLAFADMEGSAPDDDDLFLDEEVSDDPITRFKEMDPRDIIDAKYLDLEGRTTSPWDEDYPEDYVPMTGRPDPLTRIREAIPDELMPMRSEPTDDSQIQLYAASFEATRIVDGVSNSLRCYNVLQIGLQKLASFGAVGGGGQFSMREGQARGFGFFIEGVSGQVMMMVTSISPDLVIVNYTASADNIDLGISKTQHFIPSKGY